MRILALETSSFTATVAALENGTTLGQTGLDPHQRTARSLAGGIATQLDTVGWQPRQIELVAVTEGPGSFTGLRVGVTTAKTLAYVVGAELIGVNTLAVIAAQVPPDALVVDAILDAHRRQVFSARFHRRGDGVLEMMGQTHVIEIDGWLARLEPSTTVTGWGLRELQDRLPQDIPVVDQRWWTPEAATVGKLAYRDFQAGRRDDLWKMVPRYYRPSAAEEKWEARNESEASSTKS